MKNKKCTKCKITKPINEFYKNKTTKDGYCYQCKKCKSEKNKKGNLKACGLKHHFQHLYQEE